MKIFNRLLIFILVLIFYISANLVQVPTTGTSFMQVKTKTSFFVFQETECVFTYDKDVIKVLSEAGYSRFSIKTESGEVVLNQLFARLVYKEEVNGDTVLYYYSPILERYIYLNEKKVNLQVVTSDEITTIGYPMIDIGF